jgi:hypothetical protein
VLWLSAGKRRFEEGRIIEIAAPDFGDEDSALSRLLIHYCFRVFDYTASSQGVLVFHAFVKKTQRTPPLEIELGRKRLKELFDE